MEPKLRPCIALLRRLAIKASCSLSVLGGPTGPVDVDSDSDSAADAVDEAASLSSCFPIADGRDSS